MPERPPREARRRPRPASLAPAPAPDLAPPRPAALAPLAAGATPAPDVAGVLRLQRVLGNQHVQQVMRGGGAPAAAPPSPRAPAPAEQFVKLHDRDHGGERWVAFRGPEFRAQYIDNNVVEISAKPDPDTAVVSSFTVLYKDGRKLEFDIEKFPLNIVAIGSTPVVKIGFLGAVEFELKDGFIFPIRERFTRMETPNLSAMRMQIYWIQRARAERLFYAQLVYQFAGAVASLGGFHSLVSSFTPRMKMSMSKPILTKPGDTLRRAGLKTPAKPGGGGAAPKPAAKPAYQNLNPKADAREQHVGKILQQNITDDVIGAPRMPGRRSGDYRFVPADARTKVAELQKKHSGDLQKLVTEIDAIPGVKSADHYAPTGSMRNQPLNIIKKSGQAEVVVVDFHQGPAAKAGLPQAQQIAADVFRTPNHDIKRLIFVQGDSVILDTRR